MIAYGGLQIAAGVTAFVATNAGVKLTSTNVPTLAVIAASQFGDRSIVAAPATGRLTLKPGIYEITGRLSLEGEFTSGTPADAIGVITAQVYQAGVAVAGTRGQAHTQAEGQVASIGFGGIVEVTEAQLRAGTNYVEAFLLSGDANGNDVIVREGQFYAIRLDG